MGNRAGSKPNALSTYSSDCVVALSDSLRLALCCHRFAYIALHCAIHNAGATILNVHLQGARCICENAIAIVPVFIATSQIRGQIVYLFVLTHTALRKVVRVVK